MSRLDEYLKARGISRRHLSKETGIDLRTISRLCTGRSGGRLDTWRLIASRLGCKLSDIMED